VEIILILGSTDSLSSSFPSTVVPFEGLSDFASKAGERVEGIRLDVVMRKREESVTHYHAIHDIPVGHHDLWRVASRVGSNHPSSNHG
jgi:hypothetical protein